MHPLLRLLLCTALALTALASGIAAQDLDAAGALGSDVTLKLTNGDTISGRLISNQGLDIVIEHDLLGRIVIPRTTIVLQGREPEPEEEVVELVSPWSGSFDVRLSGSSGNTRDKDYGGELNVRHETESDIDTVLITYTKETASRKPGKNTTKNESFSRYRHEWKIAESRWRPFAQTGVETDQFKNWDYRVEAAGGWGYLLVDEDSERLLGRFGGGANKRIGATDDNEDVNYEALLGLDYSIDFSASKHFFVEATYFPSVSNSGDYRTFSKGELRFDLADDSSWYFKVGADHKYDNTPDPGDDQNDFNYYAGVGSRF